MSTGADAVTENMFNVVRRLLSMAFRSDTLHWRSEEIQFLQAPPIILHRNEAAFPSYTTIWKTIRPDVLRGATISSVIVALPVKTGTSGAFQARDVDEPVESSNTAINLPSAYAIEDIATPAVWNYFALDAVTSQPDAINNRQLRSDCRMRISVDEGTRPLRRNLWAYKNDNIDIHLVTPLLATSPIALTNTHPTKATRKVIRGRVEDIFGVQHYSQFTENTGLDTVSSSDTPAHLQFVDYNYQQHNTLGYKLLLKPGDIVAVIRVHPLGAAAAADTLHRVYIVHRFWPRPGEVTRHIIAPTPDIPAPPNSRIVPHSQSLFFSNISNLQDSRHIDVLKVVVTGDAGFRSYRNNLRSVPSIGKLENGEDYFIYRFLLYSDGFHINFSDTRSLQGVYLSILNFNEFGRNATTTTRIISVTPHNVSQFAVFDAILDDLRTGCTVGFQAVDANGVQRRIFLDLVAVFGDTPALNYSLDVGGHSSHAPCHLCSFRATRINQNLVTYADLPSQGRVTCHTRFTFRHRALRHSASPAHVYKTLGAKSTSDLDQFPMHAVENMYAITRANIPTTDQGVRLLPAIFSPYHSSFITPDHLLTGLFKSCLKFAIISLPNNAVRARFETEMKAVTRYNHIPTISKIVTTDSSTGYMSPLTCSELYVCVSFAPVIYTKLIHSLQTNDIEVITKVFFALDLLATISRLIVSCWRTDNPNTYIRNIQELTRRYLRKVKAVHSVGVPHTSYVDTPNVHRMYEFAFNLLPLMGHAAFSQELNMEKRHTALKASVRKSNHVNPHLFAMRNACVEDWKARIALLDFPISPDVQPRCRSAMRLLAGKSFATAHPQPIDAALAARLNTVAIGPGLPPSREFKSLAYVSPRTYAQQRVDMFKSCRLGSKRHRIPSDSFNHLPQYAKDYILAGQAGLPNPPGEPEPGAHVESTHPFLLLNYIPSWSDLDAQKPFRIRRRSCIEMTCFSPANFNIHTDHVLQTHRSFTTLGDSINRVERGVMHWYVEYIILPHINSLYEDAILVVLPIVSADQNIFPLSVPQLDPPPASPLPPPRAYSTARVLRNDPKRVARVDRTIARLGVMPVNSNNPDHFIPLTKADGFPPHQG